MVKPFLYGIAVGAVVGLAGGTWLAAARQDRKETTQVLQSVEHAKAQQSHMDQAATRYEGAREAIEVQSEAPAHDLETLLGARPDVRDLDLGADWLCIADRAAGFASARCPTEPAAAVSGAAAAGEQPDGRGAPGVPPRGAGAPDLPGTPRRTGGGDPPQADGAGPPQTPTGTARR